MAASRWLGTVVVCAALMTGCGGQDDHGSHAEDDGGEPSRVSSSAPPETSSTERPPATPSASATEAEDPVSVSLYDADFTIGASGGMSVVETLTLDVPVADRHGIIRYFDDAGVAEGFTATIDGSRTPVKSYPSDGQDSYAIGDPERTLSVGEHVVRMEYQVADALSISDSDGPWFDWELVPDGWEMKIAAAELTVQLPGPAGDVECFVGEVTCVVDGIGTAELTVTAGPLEPHTPVRLRVIRD